jgi:membrane protease YdiL (CAAX protease family)
MNDFFMTTAPDRWRHVLALLVGILPLYLFAFLFQVLRERDLELIELLVYPLVFGGGWMVVILLLHRFICLESLGTLQRMPGTLSKDIAHGLLLTLLFIVVAILQQVTVARWFPSEPAPEIRTIMTGLNERPWLLAVWLGPVVWIGVAAFEEIARVFLLSRLWHLWKKPTGAWTAIVLSAVLFGMVHIYQGWLGVISTGLLGLIGAWYYYSLGRLWPLIISHALYDSAWIVVGVIIARRGMI